MSLGSWYHAQYSTWNRTRRIQMPPFLATNAQRQRTEAAADAVIINMATIAANNPAANASLLVPGAAGQPKVETLFGPPVGVGGVNPPEWTNIKDDAEEEEELTMDVVQEWVRKSKEEAGKPVATTTLQALVNLKRPTLRLTPLQNTEDHPHPSAHGLEFEYDCDAAKCRVSIRAVSPSAPSTLVTIFDQIVDAGFAKNFNHGAVLELEKLDVSIATVTKPEPAASTSTSTPTPAMPAAKKRFSAFHFNKRREASGPALPVVDADAEANAARASVDEEGAAPGAGPAAPKIQGGEHGGVKVIIRLEALDEQGNALKSRNAQLTFLHVMRIAPTAAPTPGPSTTPSPTTDSSEASWLVKVVRREALIGRHSFRLQEIYGLASASPSSSSSSSAPPAAPTTYPPTPAQNNVDGPATECVLCLSSPREVVLLPCRHLVACRECAVNMVEFGAGGALTHETEATEATTGAEGTGAPSEGVATEATAGSAPVVAAPVVPDPARTRRKRKAKGWFCPVCRQPYTALLRITTTPPGKRLSEDSFHTPAQAVPVPVPAPAAAEPTHQRTPSAKIGGMFGKKQAPLGSVVESEAPVEGSSAAEGSRPEEPVHAEEPTSTKAEECIPEKTVESTSAKVEEVVSAKVEEPVASTSEAAERGVAGSSEVDEPTPIQVEDAPTVTETPVERAA